MKKVMSRRSALRKVTGGTVAVAAATSLSHRLQAADEALGSKLKYRINHSVCKWCYGSIPLEEFCQAGKKIGLQSVELLEVNDFPTLKKHDLVCAMVSGVPGGITQGLNRVENHDKIVAFFEKTAPIVADHGYPNIICFSGNRAGMDDQQGWKIAPSDSNASSHRRKKQSHRLHGTAEQQASTTRITCATTRLGESNCANVSALSVSNCSTTSTTCRSWKGT